MKFIKDILLFDVETSGPDPDKDVIVQLGVVLLDKDNLLEKRYMHTYVRNSMLHATLLEHAASAHVDVRDLQLGKKPLELVRELPMLFPASATLAPANTSRLLFLKNMYRKQAVAFPYDLNCIDLWTLYYLYGVRTGLKKIPTLHTLAEQLHTRV
ncbi:MAG: hypothetical protein KBD66_00770, partial [Candidatus Doudnabacteria bacterium]|nr:hypothetical protein [Candidatus Doudnabacteria bacterium]